MVIRQGAVTRLLIAVMLEYINMMVPVGYKLVILMEKLPVIPLDIMVLVCHQMVRLLQ